ncbi:hypothetical protein GWG65_34500 [Bradyrhizobium sp. CSA207]|uniref:TIR domain-containing protein n=1 Tax=Bradyrhizobium sp. CSA207 TaxID=2698826 RepID=UPI0023AFB63A|nr:TIR domain-containing protein [Bradyrhizobium sp. CSA207]MDE5446386.1 hypothetical protein [Bradyrhizobium sp. CSA207]
MAYNDPSYVVFDGDEDKWAYGRMKGWKALENIDFDFQDAHDLDSMTSRAQGEKYVKGRLRGRMENSTAVIVLIGEKTKNLHKFVRWELDLALELGLPIIAVNLNEKRAQDQDRCPPIIRDECAVHIPFKMKAIKWALDHWPSEFRGMDTAARAKGARHYSDEQYKALGL